MIDIKKQLELASANQTGKPKVAELGSREYKHVEMAKEKNSKTETLDELYHQVELVAKMLCARGKDITSLYPDWRDVGFALADGIGEEARPIFHELSSLYPNYNYSETDKQFDHCLRMPPSGRKITIGTFFQKAKEAGIDLSAAYRETHPIVDTLVNEKPSLDDTPKEKVTKKRGRPKKNEKEKADELQKIESFIVSRWLFRRNILTGMLEIALVEDGNLAFHDLDDTAANTIWRELRLAGIKVRLNEIYSLINSNFTDDFDPVKSYLESLPTWDGTTDHIRQLANMVHCSNMSPEEFYLVFKKWFVGIFKGYFSTENINEAILTLLGKQGCYKSTFFRILLPPELRKYYFEEKAIDAIDKDYELRLAKNLLINFDDMKALSRQNLNKLKAVVTQKFVNVRAPYDRYPKLLPRRASLAATGNEAEFLIDPTGNRRWIVANVESIDNPHTANINYEGIYSQVFSLVNSTFQTWFSDEEITLINERNKEFEQTDETYEYILTHFRKPSDTDTPQCLTSTDIKSRFPSNILTSSTKIGLAMKKLGYESKRSNKGRFYLVVQVNINDIGKNVVEDADEDNGKPF